MPRERYWNTERLCNLAKCIRQAAIPTDDRRLAIAGDEGVTRRVCKKYWENYDETPQFAQIMKAISHLGSIGIIDTSQAKIRGKRAVRYVNTDPDDTKKIIMRAGSMYSK